jgi:hypothetical protein
MRCVLRMAGVRIGGVAHHDGAQISFERPIGDSLQVIDLINFTPEQLEQLAGVAKRLAEQLTGKRRRLIRKVLKRCWGTGGDAWTPEFVLSILRRYLPHASLSERKLAEVMREFEQTQPTTEHATR